MAAIARYVRIAAFAAMLQVHFPFWHHLLEMIRINMHDIFQREDSISRHPGQCKTFTHPHGATSENEPRTMLLGCSLNNCGKHTVLPNLAIDCVTAMVCVVTCSLSEQVLSTYCTPQSWEASTVSRSGKQYGEVTHVHGVFDSGLFVQQTAQTFLGSLHFPSYCGPRSTRNGVQAER